MTETKDGYYLGIDIRTDSIGWAVADENYNIMSAKGKRLWGVRLFEEGETAKKRKSVRKDRRRTERRKNRIDLLQGIFKEEIDKVDESFFIRLKESRLLDEDKSTQNVQTLFNDISYSDKEYYKDYPTIYHLRKELIHSNQKKDIRLIYLAIHHIIKRRGHFHFEGDVSNVTSFTNVYEKFVKVMRDELGVEFICNDIDEVAKVFKSKILGITQKKTKLIELFNITKDNKQATSILGLVVGGTAKFGEVFVDEEVDKLNINRFDLSEWTYEEVYTQVKASCKHICYPLEILKDMYDWTLLANILQDENYDNGISPYLSYAKVSSYNKHHENLRDLKLVVREIGQVEYSKMFNSTEIKANYCAYIGSVKVNGKKVSINRCEKEEFYSYVRNSIKSNYHKLSSVGTQRADYILELIRQEKFLDLQMQKNNRVIPSQLHKLELDKILDNAERHYEFFTKKDASGITNSEKIKKLYSFRVPYYVGPLNDYHKNKGGNSWIVRRNIEKITPWNFEKVVDIDESVKKFIERLTKKCQYFVGEKVLPMNSLVYSEFELLDELNKITVDSKKLEPAIKKELIENLFKKTKQVTRKRLCKYLKENYGINEESIGGMNGRFIKTLSSYNDFKKKVFGDKIDEPKYQVMAEKIIRYITIYGLDKKILLRTIKKEFGELLSEKQLEEIANLRYEGWGKYSEKLLTKTKGICYETGERLNIMDAMKNTGSSFIEILGTKYSFIDIIDKYQDEVLANRSEISYDNLIKNLVVPANIKKSIWQTMKIVEEIKKVKEKQPKKIFVSVAKGAQEKLRTEYRKDKLLTAYSKRSEDKKWIKEIEDKKNSELKSIKLYLYYTQKGKCMYTGEDIDIEDLSNTNLYDKDHIYPISKTKDDSIDNLVLVSKMANIKKANNLVPRDIQKNMSMYWAMLLKQGLISQEKYNRLTRSTPLTPEELAKFINNQFVDSAYSTKVVSGLLKKTNESSEVVYVKSNLVAEFRQKIIDMPKITGINDLYQAKDAYLNIVVGNVYNSKFTSNPLKWLEENMTEDYSLNKLYDNDIEVNGKVAWKKGEEGTRQTVKGNLNKNAILYTRPVTLNKGELFNRKMVSPKNNPDVSIKKGLEVEKYGGYKSKLTAYFTLVEYKDSRGKVCRNIESIPLYLEKEFNKYPQKLNAYLEENYGLTEARVIIPKIKKNTLFKIDGFPMHLRGTTGRQVLFQNAVQNIIDVEKEYYIRNIEKYLAQNERQKDKKAILMIDEYSKITKEENMEIYDYLVQKNITSIYKHRPANCLSILEEGREKFKNIDVEKQCIVIGEILNLFKCRPLSADLSLIGGAKRVGNIQITKKISLAKEAVIVHQSITGIYEKEINILKYN